MDYKFYKGKTVNTDKWVYGYYVKGASGKHYIFSMEHGLPVKYEVLNYSIEETEIKIKIF